MRTIITLLTISLSAASTPLAAKDFLSHPPMRPLPVPPDRPMAEGPAYFVDSARGDDTNRGSKQEPWRTVNHALRHVPPGGTLYLRGGTYYEHVVVPTSGEEGKPITIRSYPRELAVIDGGLREFYEAPESAWEPYAEGAEGEYVSTKSYPAFANRPILNHFLAAGWEPFYGKEDQRPVVQGNFGDSMVPLHGYRTLADLRDGSMLWDVEDKFEKTEGVYCGPGLWYNRRTGRIHCRLAHTNLEGLGKRAYRGVTDPRKIPLVISGPFGADVLRINGIRHLVLQDLVLRGASGSPLINLYGSESITLDGLTVYGGSPSLLVKATSGLKIVNCAFRSLAAPWSSRASMKYRGTPSYAIITQRNKPENHDFEFASNEFTDGHDFAWLRYVRNLRFHHNFVDNFNDDGVEVGAKRRDQELYVYQNLLSRCLITFTLHEMEPDESPPEVSPESGVYITRNVIDLRRGVFKGPPRTPDADGSYLRQSGTLCGDHGGPVWPQYFFYHNTVLRADRAWRGYYGFGIGGRGLRGTRRQVLNNIFVQIEGLPGLNFTAAGDGIFADGNLHWGLLEGPSYEGDFLKTEGRGYAFRKEPRPESWMQHDRFADPEFTRLVPEPDGAIDLTLQPDSPAVNAGAPIPKAWLDPLRQMDEGKPDIGAFPSGAGAWRVGVRGRMSVFGGEGS